VSSVRAELARHGVELPDAESRGSASGLQAVFCVVGHPNPPHAANCRQCAADIADRSVRLIAPPVLGRLRFSTGATVDLDRSLLVGRRPTTEGWPAHHDLPALITLPDPEQALSRAHAEVRVQGWDVYVVDLGSTNGTSVELPGRELVTLRPQEPYRVLDGTRVTLGQAASFVLEVAGL
jgi:hypothetical protein